MHQDFIAMCPSLIMLFVTKPLFQCWHVHWQLELSALLGFYLKVFAGSKAWICFILQIASAFTGKVMKEMNCDVLRSTSHGYFNPSSCWQRINIWKQGGLSRRTATSGWKKQHRSPEDLSLFHTMRARPLVIAGPLSPSHMLLYALFLATIMRVPWRHSGVN